MTRYVFFNGTVMRGQPDHANLRDAEFVRVARTAPRYRLYSIDDRHPGMFEVSEGGVSVEGELYRMSEETWRTIERREPPGLYLGPVALEDGSQVEGMLYPRELAEGRHRDISEYGSWRRYLAARGRRGEAGEAAVPPS